MRPALALLGSAITVLALLTAPSAASPNTGHTASGAPVVHTDNGAVRGLRGERTDSFLGIPYAAPPTGPRRWQPPQPASSWRGVRQAQEYGPRCAQLAGPSGDRSEAEDCLYLNVIRPRDTRPWHRKPVYVFIHGGGLVNGSANLYRGRRLAAETGAVVVTINYRLGVFGFLGHPALTAENGESGNYGLQDQQAALRWVQRNAQSFGGSPHRVTIGGESAGGWSVCGHLAAPGSRGLFTAAMLQSGSCFTISQQRSENIGSSVAERAGCTAPETAARCLRDTPAARLLDASPGNNEQVGFVHGRNTLPHAPREAVRTGRFTRVPVVTGANRDEARFFSVAFLDATEQDYVGWVHATFGEDAGAVLARYPWPERSDRFTAAYLTAAVMTDQGSLGIGGCAQRRLTRDFARHTRTYAYEFAHRTGPGPLTPIPGYEWGAAHAAELAYLWPELGGQSPISDRFDAAERRLAGDMTSYWGAFIRWHAPHAPTQQAWPEYRRGGRILSLRAGGASTTLSDADYVNQHQCEFWDGRRPVEISGPRVR